MQSDMTGVDEYPEPTRDFYKVLDMHLGVIFQLDKMSGQWRFYMNDVEYPQLVASRADFVQWTVYIWETNDNFVDLS